MKARPKPLHATKSARKRKQRLQRLGVWIFIALFAFSVVGFMIAVQVVR